MSCEKNPEIDFSREIVNIGLINKERNIWLQTGSGTSPK
jgi:hypothetical protein